MSTVGDLLPDSAGPFIQALAAGFSDTLPVPLRQIMDPATTPEAFLPWLAAHRSADLWFPDWPINRRRQMVANAIRLARIKGTRQAVIDFLEYVDGQLLDTVSYPERFIIGRAIIGRTPVNHPPFMARHLVKVETFKEPRAFVLGRAVFGSSILKTPNREKLNRCRGAITVAKAPETELRVDFAHMRQATLGDGFTFGSGLTFGRHLDRTVLS